MTVREMIVKVLALVLFLSGSSFLIWRESSGVYLKSGIGIYMKNETPATALFSEAVKRDPNNFMARYYLGKSLLSKTFLNKTSNLENSILLINSKKEFQEAKLLRSDSVNHLALALVYERGGDIISALGEYNVSFFLSQNREELSRWKQYRNRVPEVAKKFFDEGNVNLSLILVFNRVSNYRPFYTPDGAGRFLADYFLSIHPDRWLSNKNLESKQNLLKLYRSRSKTKQATIKRNLKNSGFDFLVEVISDAS